jgi:hypothetical protein
MCEVVAGVADLPSTGFENCRAIAATPQAVAETSVSETAGRVDDAADRIEAALRPCLDYCEQDTLAMVRIVERLRN